MNRQTIVLSTLALVLIGGTACFLGQVRTRQSLAPPGLRTHTLPDSIRLQADLPEKVLDFESKLFPIEDVTLGVLPPDTSFGQSRYTAPDGFWLDLRVVLMGHDRTSLHKPQICLTGQGWQIDEKDSRAAGLPMEQPLRYDLPVVALIAHKAIPVDGQNRTLSGVYVYWYVADDALSASASGIERMWQMASKLVRTGVLQRWAYVSCFAPCVPGQENATFERMKRFITAAVPQFQLYPRQEPKNLTAAR